MIKTFDLDLIYTTTEGKEETKTFHFSPHTRADCVDIPDFIKESAQALEKLGCTLVRAVDVPYRGYKLQASDVSCIARDMDSSLTLWTLEDGEVTNIRKQVNYTNGLLAEANTWIWSQQLAQKIKDEKGD